MMPVVSTGIDVLLKQGFSPLRRKKVGLLTHDAAVDSRLRKTEDIFRNQQEFTLVRLFGPEHGIGGVAQDLIPVGGDERPGVVSLYGDSFASLKPKLQDLEGLDCLVVDLVDVGSRYYTFQATMLYCMEAAAEVGLPVMILDRPNPLGGEVVEGPTIKPGYESFVGPHPIATRHGLTIAELASLYKAERSIHVELQIIHCQGWQRRMYFPETALPWVLPSPNMPTFDTSLVYPGQCLLEGTSLSEGRGTTRPFELCGGPFPPDAFAYALNILQLPGVFFRACQFRPTFQKFAGQTISGVQLHVTDKEVFQPVRTTTALLVIAKSFTSFAWRREKYEFVDHLPAIDILYGSDRERKAIDAGATLELIFHPWEAEEEAFRKRRQPFLLYR